jgi:potassium efflux system protein
LNAIGLQTRQLLQVGFVLAVAGGLWAIWVDVFPALGVLDRVKLWERATTQTAAAAAGKQAGVGEAVGDGAAGENARQEAPALLQPEQQWVTLKHLVIAGVILVVTFLAIRNIPGLLELMLLQRLPLDAGARYATITIFRYAITIVGIVIACKTLGIRWSDYQWLVAAATVGLGFGLQEIFANFVSGLIVLLERPIRVGDIVTVEGVTGIVSKIRMRATTVTNWDRQEFVVPNKEFVTGRLLNWTLSNPVNRIVVNVGVAYGSDTAKVQELLLQVAHNHPLILDDPAPLATFEGFGDSTLNFVLRCYLPDFDKRLVTIHELHSEVARAFAESGIEIAFPQRDIHVRSWAPPTSADQPKERDTFDS